MEYPWRAPQKTPTWFKPDFKIVNGNLRVPTTPGMGLEIDPGYLQAATVVAKVSPAVTNFAPVVTAAFKRLVDYLRAKGGVDPAEESLGSGPRQRLA